MHPVAAAISSAITTAYHMPSTPSSSGSSSTAPSSNTIVRKKDISAASERVSLRFDETVSQPRLWIIYHPDTANGSKVSRMSSRFDILEHPLNRICQSNYNTGTNCWHTVSVRVTEKKPYQRKGYIIL